jgi:hypothetical protein
MSTNLYNRRTCLRRLNRFCSELGGEVWLAWNYDEFEGCDIAEQLGWVDREAFYTLAKGSKLWDKNKGALGFLQALLDEEGKYEVRASSKWKRVKWFVFSLKGLRAPSVCPQQQWAPCGGTRRRLPLSEHSPTRRVRGSIAPEAEGLPAPPALDAAVDAAVEEMEETVTYHEGRHSMSSNLQGIETVRVKVSELKNGRKPNDAERYAALEVINAAKGSKSVAQLLAANNKPVAVAVLTTTRGNSDVATLSK